MVWLYVVSGWTLLSVAAVLPVARVLRFHEVAGSALLAPAALA